MQGRGAGAEAEGGGGSGAGGVAGAGAFAGAGAGVGAGAGMRRGERVQGSVLPRVPVRHLRTFPRVARGESRTEDEIYALWL